MAAYAARMAGSDSYAASESVLAAAQPTTAGAPKMRPSVGPSPEAGRTCVAPLNSGTAKNASRTA